MTVQGQSINQDTFSDCYLEWRYKEGDLRLRVQGINDLDCPACFPAPHTLHIDANMKLYVWDLHRQLWREEYHAGLLFQSMEECQQHMREIDAAAGNIKVRASNIGT